VPTVLSNDPNESNHPIEIQTVKADQTRESNGR
jgi:hypothetical protein